MVLPRTAAGRTHPGVAISVSVCAFCLVFLRVLFICSHFLDLTQNKNQQVADMAKSMYFNLLQVKLAFWFCLSAGFVPQMIDAHAL